MSLYLKYRPSDFTNLVWQSFVKETLQKAIENEKTVWAYLLCGPRWTGKTTTARILAKTINCENPKNWNPCLKCKICKEFADEKLIDIIEIDAASHTWVENIREIIEKAHFTPTETKFKVYIIDEVHMLSKWAFNALLKILEEPPSHVKFILATTETHKVPETIISRCQRYDFKRISDEDIKNRLDFIAKSEKIKIDNKSIDYIIKNSSGWLRNAISLFEQLITDSEINYKKVVEQLEIVDENTIEEFMNKLLKKDSSVIETFEKQIEDWKNIKLFIKELLFYTKNKSLELLKSNSDISDYLNILEVLDEIYSKTKNSLDENMTFLIGILRILNPPILNSFPPREKEAAVVKENIVEKKEVKKEKIEKIEKKEELTNEDLNDVFWEDKEQPHPWIPSPLEEKEAAKWNFNENNFINKLKENWAKWGLTMNLRWAWISIIWSEFIISTKTNFAKKQIETGDNLAIIQKTLADMWYDDIQVIIK